MAGEEHDGFGFFVDLPAPEPKAAGTPAPAPTVAHPSAARQDRSVAAPESATLRVSVEKVDQLINLVGELVITQAMLAQTGKSLDPVTHQQLVSCLVDLERNTRQLQESVMAIRMIPMSSVFSRFPRMLRDLAAQAGQGGRTAHRGRGHRTRQGNGGEDHRSAHPPGPQCARSRHRIARGPAGCGQAGGRLDHPVRRSTRAGRSRSRYATTDVDCSAGRSWPRPASAASRRARSMSDQEVWQLIFEPGFSTAEAVTEVSGRGVGMDVVRRNIIALGGSVELDSAEGYGTRVTVKLPLTLAIMDGMSIGVADETYILPLASVVESIQIKGDEIRTLAGDNRVINVRDQYLPVVPLEEVFNVPRFSSAGTRPSS
jgi:two-component system chemotaxis sensor kinase CheA